MKKTEFACVIYTILLLAGCTQKNAAEVKFISPAPLEIKPVSSAPISENSGFKIYKVQPGENILDVSHKFKVEIAVIIELNEMGPPYRLQSGQVIRLPGEEEKVVAVKKPIVPVVKEHHITPPVVPDKKPIKLTSSGYFEWPYKGNITSAYGDKGGGLFNNGVNISTRDGAKIVAADGGEVIYSGKDVKGYGNLIIIKHERGWITTYSLAHAKVSQGQMVAKGEELGVAGSEIHFAMRKDKTLVNPEDYLN